MELTLEYEDGQTPLDEDEKEGLLLPGLSTRGELDEFEQKNIEQAVLWTLKKTMRPEYIFSEGFVKTLHKKMYEDVWNWAGDFRKTNKNLGVDKWQIATELRCLLEDAKVWMETQTWPPDEIAIRFKHRIVSIHCFANGNGRHSRLMADVIVSKIFRKPVFTWGARNLSKNTNIRTAYLQAVKAADHGSFESLLEFARS